MDEKNWTVEDAMREYNVSNWGGGFFTVNEAGHLCVTPYGQPGPMIDMMDVLEDVQEKGLGFPCVIRFQDVLRTCVTRLNDAFRRSIEQQGYGGRYFGVFPVKVNQMREVVEEILDAGASYHYGLEAGSKPELIAALSLNADPEALTVCNGYKDEDFMRLALTGRKLGRKTIVVIEKLSELPLLLRVADEMGVEPLVGVRSKLSTKGAGKWESSSGDFAKFGLTVPEIVEAVRILREHGKEHCLKLFHFHVGSQLTDIRSVKDAVGEGARVYAKLRKMGLPVEYFDVGGGLAVDYMGANATWESSMNYTLQEYVDDIVYNVQQICESEDVPEPNLVSESGRAITAFHSCIVMNVFGSIEFGGDNGAPSVQVEPEEDSYGAELLSQMRDILDNVSAETAHETYHDVSAKKEEALQAFRLGILGLEERAAVETTYWTVCRELVKLVDDLEHVPEDLADLSTVLADQYLANFSVFQSVLDHWALEQLFPVMPVHRLNEPPTRDAVLVDITCDSDGKIDDFVGIDGKRETTRLHPLNADEPYFIAVFLTGAYQDIMGDMHNLFGRTNEVHVFVDDDDPEDFYIETVLQGDQVAEVLTRVQYEPPEILKQVKQAVDEQVRRAGMKPKEGVALLEFLEDQLKGYTYLLSTNANGLDRIGPEQIEALKARAAAERSA